MAKKSARHKQTEYAYRSLVDLSYLSYAILQQGRVVFCNEALTEIFGYSPIELMDMSAAEVIENMHPDDRDHAVETMSARFEGGNPPPVQHLRIRHKDGRYLWVETTAARVSSTTARPCRSPI